MFKVRRPEVVIKNTRPECSGRPEQTVTVTTVRRRIAGVVGGGDACRE